MEAAPVLASPVLSVPDAYASPEPRPEGIEIDGVGRVVRPTATAAAGGNRGSGVEDVVDRSEQLDVLAARAHRYPVGHGKPEIAHGVHPVGADRVLDSRIVARIFRPD